jgi:hypothetical protein
MIKLQRLTMSMILVMNKYHRLAEKGRLGFLVGTESVWLSKS